MCFIALAISNFFMPKKAPDVGKRVRIVTQIGERQREYLSFCCLFAVEYVVSKLFGCINREIGAVIRNTARGIGCDDTESQQCDHSYWTWQW